MSAEELITGAAARALLYAPTDAAARSAYEVGLLRGLLREKCAELAAFTDGPGRTRGDYATVHAGDAEVLVEFDFVRGEEPIYDVESPGVGPGCPPSLRIERALVNGAWIDPRDAFPDQLIERWEQTLLERQLEAA